MKRQNQFLDLNRSADASSVLQPVLDSTRASFRGMLMLLLLCTWPGASTVQAATADAVGAWGNNDYGQTDVPVAAQSGVTAITAGEYHTVALKNDGTVVVWGYNVYGQTTVPAGLSGVTAIAAGFGHTVALVGNPVSLQARRSEKDLVLSWPARTTGFTLQSTLSLTPPVVWIDSTSAPVVIGAQFTVTNAPSGRAQYYRLKK